MTGTSSVQTKIVLLINVVLTAFSAILYTYWKVKVDIDKVVRNNSIYTYNSVAVWFSFGIVLGDVITTFACRSSSSWKYWDLSYIIHCICYIILYIIGAGSLFVQIFTLSQGYLCNHCKYDMLKGCIVIGFLIVVVSIVELFFHYKDHKANKDDA